MNTADQSSLNNETVTEVLTENTAQSVLNHLKALESNRARMLTRWIWELLQNARDTSPDAETCLVASVAYRPGELVFQHNGSRFKINDIAHLIYHGSTKVEDEETIGQYGSGFLTTHLLSRIIAVSGQLDDGQAFKFCLNREVGSVKELSASMARAREDFNNSLSTGPEPDDFTTQFRYPIAGEGSATAVRDGLKALKRCAPFVVVFNCAFSRIDIKSSNEAMSFKVTKRKSFPQDGFQEITVSRNENGSQKDGVFFLAKGAKTSVAVPLEPTDGGGRALLPVNNTPRLFLGFPLIGTEDFSFPAIINSFEFTPTEDRDGVYLWRSDDEANRENQVVVEEACDLLIGLLRSAASSGWCNTYVLANVPAICKQNWLTSDRLREFLKEHLIEKIRQTPVVLSKYGALTPQDSILPFAEKGAGVETLWDLLDGLEEFRQKLPRRNEAVGWSKAIRSWAALRECQPTSFDEAFDGRTLASLIEKECSHLEDLQKLLREGVCAVEWLNQLYQFLKDNGLFDDEIRSLSIFPAQDGRLDELSERGKLHRDQGIAEKLKDVAGLLGWNIRRELRDTRLTSLADERGAGDKDSVEVVRQLIARLQHVEDNPDDNFTQASVRLFAWILAQDQKKWTSLRGFPVFAKSSEPDSRRAFRMERQDPEEDDNRRLAPIGAWAEELKQFSDLFPQRQILADAFFEAVPDPDTWRILDEQGFIRTNVVIRREVSSDTVFSDRTFRLKGPRSGDGDDTKHRTVDCITVTDIAFLTGIMARVRQSPRRAYLFWRFLTEWLVKEDAQGLEVRKSRCTCERTHQHFQAAWLVQVGENQWIRRGDTSFQATAQSLANLLRDSEWKPGSLNKNPAAVKLLEAIGVTRFDLTRELVSKNAKERAAMNDQLTYLITATDGDFSHVLEFVEDLQNDERLPDILKKHREYRQMVQKNQRLGKCVEGLVKKSLEDEGFTVTRTGIGSDYEIELSKEDQKWLIEVKSTQGQEVRMTDTQARKAVEKEDGFLLCVVPVESGTPALDEVRDKMRFVKNIGSLVEPLCNDLDKFKNLRDEITDDSASDVQLVVEAGTARVRVASSVWEKDGFHLKNLAERLKEEET